METLKQLLEAEWCRNSIVLLGVLVALISIATARSIARKKQAADLLFASRQNSALQDAARCIEKHHVSNTSNIRALAASDKIDDVEAKQIRLLLNHFELVSVGIQNGIYDEKIIKDSWCSIVVRTYTQARPFIEALRENGGGRNTTFQEFELLAKRWEGAPLKKKSCWKGTWRQRLGEFLWN